MTSTEIARMAGNVSRPSVSTIVNIAGVPGANVRRGISPKNAQRLVAAFSAGMLTEKLARSIADDPHAVIRACDALREVVEEIVRAKGEGSGAITAA
ncbi:hypothetical protein HYE82_28345 [Streptomyces sp. BR123]|uniref:hypothetical protein n=1 Tax=Streptomyces sp. BR123 TaxID=2749828 RepID=UPI0015C49EBA|nr:hypothetical protein [Streptomyces sp. BR123]NXY98212.1 hypothetical protein [Streptomyces sp. BR123]